MPAQQTSIVDLVKDLRAGVLYFAIVFGAGFVLGVIRYTLIAPRVGARIAELAEAPVMITVSYFAARFLVSKFALPYSVPLRLTMGLTGLFLMLIAEFGIVLWLRSASFSEYLATRDPLTTVVYYISLLIFAAMPLVVERSGK